MQPSLNGVNAISCFIGFNQFDLINGFSIDYMHCIPLGVVKSLIDHWVNTANKMEAFYLNKKALTLINNRIEKVKLCRFIVRQPRSLDDRHLFKASEFRTFLLYVLPIVLKGVLREPYYTHFCLLSSSVYTLLKKEIPVNGLNSVRDGLTKFVVEFEKLYGSNRVTMNLHRLIHLVDCVKNSGPLWASSLFPFESNNAHLLKFINGTQDVLLQIGLKYNLSVSLKSINVQQNRRKENVVFKNPLQINLDAEQVELLDYIGVVNNGTLNAFASMNIDSTKYTSTHYTRAKITIDYFVKLDATYARIIFFFNFLDNKLMLIERFKVLNRFFQFVHLIEDECDIVDASVPKEKVIYIKLNTSHYIVERPNKYEKD